MEQINRALEFYHMGFMISMIVAVFGFVLALFFFFRFDIRGIFLLITGRGKARSIRILEQQNEMTGQLRDNPLDFDSGDLAENKDPSGSLAKKQGFTRKQRSGNTGSFSIAGDAAPQAASVSAVDEGATESLAPKKGRSAGDKGAENGIPPVTAYKPEVQETTVLSEEKPRFRIIEDVVVIHTDELII